MYDDSPQQECLVHLPPLQPLLHGQEGSDAARGGEQQDQGSEVLRLGDGETEGVRGRGEEGLHGGGQ